MATDMKSRWGRMSRPARALVWLVAGYVAVFFSLAVRQWTCFGRDASLYAEYNNMFWWTLHGKPFFIGSYGLSNWGMHSSYFWSFLLPIYWLVPGINTLLFLQTCALAAAAIPLFLLARKVLDHEWAAVIAAGAFLLLPGVGSQNLAQIQEPSFQPVALLFTIYFFIERRFRAFAISAVVACLLRENVPVAVAMFGLWALREKRPWKWVLFPSAFAGVYLAVVMGWAMPAFRDGQPWHGVRYFDYLGETPGQIVGTVLSRPDVVLNHLFSQDVVTYFLFLTQPMGVLLPFLSPACIIAVPELLGNLLSGWSQVRVIPYHYNVLTSTGLFVGLLFTLRKIVNRLKARAPGNAYAPVLATVALALAASHWFLWLDWSRFRPVPHRDSLLRAIAVVPSDASVLVTSRMLAHVSNRPKWDNVDILWSKSNRGGAGANYHADPNYGYSFDYAILDGNERAFNPPGSMQEIFATLYTNTNYRLIFNENNVVVFQRRAPSVGAP